MNKLGFGFLRLPRLNPEDEHSIDWAQLNQMTDAFLAGGGVYFDTAYTYLGGLSEEAIRISLVDRHPRSAFRLADKLPTWKVKTPADCEKYFNEQCARCGVEWFDVYLLHWLNREHYAIAEKQGEFAFLNRLKAEGKARKIGFSYHGSAALLEEILLSHPQVDVVQLQINYLDWDDPGIEARKCYEIAAHYGKEIVVMEPVKGGTLATLPGEAAVLLAAHSPALSPAAWALRFVTELPAVSTVLSGMSTPEQVRENLQDLSPLSSAEHEALNEVCALLNLSIAVACTGCRYCVPHCPKGIVIPDYFRIYNSYCRHPKDGWKMTPVYHQLTLTHGRASDCIACRQCERNCPQRLRISELLPAVAKALEN